MKVLAIVVFLVGFYTFCWAGLRGPPAPYALTSPGGKFVFTMTPKAKSLTAFGGVGVCHKVAEDGALKEVWRTSGWYSEDLILASDGVTLIRIGSWFSYDQDNGPIEDSLALAFYREGKLLVAYTISDLVKDLKLLVPTTAGTLWASGQGGIVPGTEYFRITTVDEITYTFSIATGKMAAENK